MSSIPQNQNNQSLTIGQRFDSLLKGKEGRTWSGYGWEVVLPATGEIATIVSTATVSFFIASYGCDRMGIDGDGKKSVEVMAAGAGAILAGSPHLATVREYTVDSIVSGMKWGAGKLLEFIPGFGAAKKTPETKG